MTPKPKLYWYIIFVCIYYIYSDSVSLESLQIEEMDIINEPVKPVEKKNTDVANDSSYNFQFNGIDTIHAPSVQGFTGTLHVSVISYNCALLCVMNQMSAVKKIFCLAL